MSVRTDGIIKITKNYIVGGYYSGDSRVFPCIIKVTKIKKADRTFWRDRYFAEIILCVNALHLITRFGGNSGKTWKISFDELWFCNATTLVKKKDLKKEMTRFIINHANFKINPKYKKVLDES